MNSKKAPTTIIKSKGKSGINTPQIRTSENTYQVFNNIQPVKKSKKKIIIIVASILFTILSLSAALSGYFTMDFNISSNNKITSALKSKHNEEFKVINTFGKIIGKSRIDSYCYPVNNKDLIFQATYEEDGSVTDNYYYSLLFKQADNLIAQKFQEKSTDVVAHSSFSSEKNIIPISKETKITDYINTNKPKLNVVNLVIKDSVASNKESITEIIKNVYTSLKINANYKIYIIGSEKFEEYKNTYIKSHPGFNSTAIENYDVKNKFAINIENGLTNEVEDYYLNN
ncbi:MAG: hypothetical protein WCQ49_01735 [Candidatus Saccharibacteria bacterium]